LVDALLLRFRNIAELAPVPEGKEVKEITAAQTFQLKVETAALVSLLAISGLMISSIYIIIS
jgi:hypothetical protein